MIEYATHFDDKVSAILRAGGVVILRTDTLYGIVARADNEAAVERVYTIKGRMSSKSPIVLIDRLEAMFDSYEQAVLDRLHAIWPGKTSLILPSTMAPSWIERGNHSVAYRLPDTIDLRRLISQTGPLIAPSANPEGQPPAMDIKEAEFYFGDIVDMYVDGGLVIDDTPSQLYRLTNETMERLR